MPSSMKYEFEVDLKKIEAIKIELGYSAQSEFAEDCGVTSPTYIRIMKTGKSGMKFLRGLSKLTKEKCSKSRTPMYFIIDEKNV